MHCADLFPLNMTKMTTNNTGMMKDIILIRPKASKQDILPIEIWCDNRYLMGELADVLHLWMSLGKTLLSEARPVTCLHFRL